MLKPFLACPFQPEAHLSPFPIIMSGATPARAPVAGAGDAANETPTQKVFGIVKVRSSPCVECITD